MPREDEEDRRWDIVPVIALVVVLLLLLMGWWLFPKAEQWLAMQDCIATGRTNCSPKP